MHLLHYENIITGVDDLKNIKNRPKNNKNDLKNYINYKMYKYNTTILLKASNCLYKINALH